MSVDPSVALFDRPVAITVSGLNPGELVTLSASALGCAGYAWRSSATFAADSRGNVALASNAPSSGSYQGKQAMGLLWSLTPRVALGDGATLCIPARGLSVQVEAKAEGQTPASVTLTRLPTMPGVKEYAERPSSTGFYGDFFAPPASSSIRPGIVIFGGSEGGLVTATEAGLLASHGYPTLALAYFGAPGLPQTLQRIPLEYFVTALRWLAMQPGVDARHLVVEGVSRGSEAALLLGSDFPQLIHAVIALVPNDVALCGIVSALTRAPCAGPAWTLGGVAIPYTSQVANPYPTDHPDAVIQVEHIAGPILLNCGGSDQVWPSCSFAAAIQSRLDAAHFAYAHELFTYPSAGHDVGYAVPYDPTFEAAFGGVSSADAIAREDFWPRQLAFLTALP